MIQLALDDRIGQADTLLNVIDDHSKAAELDVREAMAVLRRAIDDFDKATTRCKRCSCSGEPAIVCKDSGS